MSWGWMEALPQTRFGINGGLGRNINIGVEDRVFPLLLDKLRMPSYNVVDYNYILEHVKWT